MNALLALAALASVGSGAVGQLTADDFARLDMLYARAKSEQGCDDVDYRVGQARLKARFEKRLERVKTWFDRNYSSAESAAASDRAYGGPEHIMIGGCLMRDGRAVMPDTREFGFLQTDRAIHRSQTRRRAIMDFISILSIFVPARFGGST